MSFPAQPRNSPQLPPMPLIGSPPNFSRATSTITRDHVGASRTNSGGGGEAPNTSMLTTEPPVHSSDYSLDEDDLNFLPAYNTAFAPTTIPSSPATSAKSTEVEPPLSEGEIPTGIPAPWISKQVETRELPNPDKSTRNTETTSRVFYPGLNSSDPVHRPTSNDNGRIKRLLKAHGLTVRTQGLQNYYPFSRVFQPGGDIVGVPDS